MTSAELMRHEGEWWIPEPNTGCWLWMMRTDNGYGRLGGGPAGTHRAHRLVYTVLRGPIPLGLQLDHLCRVRSCVNPDHLEIVDSRTNTLRGVGVTAANSAKTHCCHGHPFNEANTRYVPLGRVCRTCAREWALRHYHETRAAK